jgi:hypothetical protein
MKSLSHRLILPLLIACLVSCKKSDTNVPFRLKPTDSFSLEENNNTQTLALTDYDGHSTPDITVSGLPTGVTVKWSTHFPTINLTFNQTPTAAAGVYSIKFTVATSSYSSSETVQLKVFPYNGWTLDSDYYRNTGGLVYETSGGWADLTVTSNYNEGTWVEMVMGSNIPTADGTYSYNLVSNANAANEIGILMYTRYRPGVYRIDSTDHQRATVKVTGGKRSVSFPPIRIYRPDTTGGATKTISMSVSE